MNKNQRTKVILVVVLAVALLVVIYNQLFKESEFDRQYRENIARQQAGEGAAPVAPAPGAAPAAGTPASAPAAPTVFQEVRTDLDTLLANVKEVDFDYEMRRVPRNPMSPLVGPFAPPKIHTETEDDTPRDASKRAEEIRIAALARSMTLSGILWDSRTPLAVLDNEVVYAGYKFPSGILVDSIMPDRVVLRFNDTLVAVELKEQ